jgi:hypothetical protein
LEGRNAVRQQLIELREIVGKHASRMRKLKLRSLSVAEAIGLF